MRRVIHSSKNEGWEPRCQIGISCTFPRFHLYLAPVVALHAKEWAKAHFFCWLEGGGRQVREDIEDDLARMAHGTLDPALISELSAIAEAEDCVLLRAERHGKILRLILDRPDEDVTLSHCERVSRQASALLDVMEPAGFGSYVLEVSSPGLDRELVGRDDYRRFLGRLARVTFQDPRAGKQTVVGRLEALREEGEGEISLVEALSKKKTREHIIPLPAIELARLEIDF